MLKIILIRHPNTIVSNNPSIKEEEVNILNVEGLDKEEVEAEAKDPHRIITITFLPHMTRMLTTIRTIINMTPLMNMNTIMAISPNSPGVEVVVQEEDVEAADVETAAEADLEVAAVAEDAAEAEAEADVEEVINSTNIQRRN